MQNRKAIGAYAVSATIWEAQHVGADGERIRVEVPGRHPTGWAAFDKSGTTWTVTAAEAEAINA
jgi:hypothetical protein